MRKPLGAFTADVHRMGHNWRGLLHYRTPADRMEEEARELRRSFRVPLVCLALGLLAFGLGYFGDKHHSPVLAFSGFLLMVIAVTSGGAWVLWRWIRLITNMFRGYKD